MIPNFIIKGSFLKSLNENYMVKETIDWIKENMFEFDDDLLIFIRSELVESLLYRLSSELYIEEWNDLYNVLNEFLDNPEIRCRNCKYHLRCLGESLCNNEHSEYHEQYITTNFYCDKFEQEKK